MNTQNTQEQVSSLSQELRRGILPLAVLGLLKEKKYGYALIGDLQEAGIEIDQGTLYPMLRRLEAQELLTSSWILEGTRPRRYYAINDVGTKMLEQLTQEWNSLNTVMGNLLGTRPS
jgi:DNA-binding PadR family transcriptional regulator